MKNKTEKKARKVAREKRITRRYPARLAAILTALMVFAPIVRGNDWPMGSPDGSWPMGTPDGSWPMGEDTARAANSRADREYLIKQHMIAIGFTKDEVLRAWGQPALIGSRSVSEKGVSEIWHYSDVLVWFENGMVTFIYEPLK